MLVNASRAHETRNSFAVLCSSIVIMGLVVCAEECCIPWIVASARRWGRTVEFLATITCVFSRYFYKFSMAVVKLRAIQQNSAEKWKTKVINQTQTHTHTHSSSAHSLFGCAFDVDTTACWKTIHSIVCVFFRVVYYICSSLHITNLWVRNFVSSWIDRPPPPPSPTSIDGTIILFWCFFVSSGSSVCCRLPDMNGNWQRIRFRCCVARHRNTVENFK